MYKLYFIAFNPSIAKQNEYIEEAKNCIPVMFLLYQTLFVTSFVTDCHGNGGKLVLYQINYYSIYVGYVVNGLLNYLMEILRPFIPTQKDTCINHIAI